MTAILATRRQLCTALALGTTLLAAPVAAQEDYSKWPERPVSYVVPFTPGGSTDVVGRTLGQHLSTALGQTFVVENRPGAAGAVGASYVARAKPDGYTLFGGTISTHAINASLYKDLSYDPVKDFEPVTLVATLPNVLMVNPKLGINSVQDLVEYLKREPNHRTFASSGSGTSTHLAGELFADLIGIPLTHVPYRGTPPAMTDVAAGNVTFMFDQITAALPFVKDGRLKLLAVTTPERIGPAPELPTMMEAGIKDFSMASWQAVYAPKGTPRPIVERLHSEIKKVLELPEVRKQFTETLGMQIVAGGPDELAAHMAAEIPRWAELVEKSGAAPN
ncbi:Bug family tripartite tricarboxylate transporter substrate binding protein [Paracandidimonas soli]|uniref:Bug family tripartite tricarboxylate transporter substrate binding protein n=1 Tax=Paracandidimonas soli TaxID=1917182 RepID=UPI003341BB58